MKKHTILTNDTYNLEKNSFGAKNRNRKIVISGSFGVGKSTLTQLLSKRTGIPMLLGKQMRQILPEYCPEKSLKDCSPEELCQVFYARFIDRKINEEKLSSGFISDGSALNEWAYLHGRLKHGAHGDGSIIVNSGYKFTSETLGYLVRKSVTNAYTDIIHIPPEFPIPDDGYRPSSEKFREHVNTLILKTWKELGITVHIITGNIEARLQKIIHLLGLKVSNTLTKPIAEKNMLWYERIEDALGDPQQRYFASGFKRINSYIYDVYINKGLLVVEAKADIVFPSQWSSKKGVNQAPHFTNIDALLLMGQLAQLLLFTQDNINREQSNNMWVRNASILNLKPIHKLQGISIKLQQTNSSLARLRNRDWRLSTMEGSIANGAIKISNYKLCYELPEHLQPND